ncbi:para-aminobenzoate synthase, subunit I, partial [Jimgerdemannia flammicorona]
ATDLFNSNEQNVYLSLNKGFYLLERHITRLLTSAEFFKLETAGRLFSSIPNTEELKKALDTSVPKHEGRKRIRLLVDSHCEITIEHTPLLTPDVPPPNPLPIVLDSQPLPSSTSPWLRHKTTRREAYDSARERAGCDYHGGRPGKEEIPFDVALWNERREVTETSIANLAVEMPREGEGESVWKTPSAECGLLQGVFRAEHLATGKLIEGVITVEDLVLAQQQGRRIRCFNSVRGEYDVVLLPPFPVLVLSPEEERKRRRVEEIEAIRQRALNRRRVG